MRKDKKPINTKFKFNYYYPFNAEARLNNTEEFRPYLKENTRIRHNKDKLDNGV
jgi:hypothetical protein